MAVDVADEVRACDAGTVALAAFRMIRFRTGYDGLRADHYVLLSPKSIAFFFQRENS
jgi:hypothetical protein